MQTRIPLALKPRYHPHITTSKKPVIPNEVRDLLFYFPGLSFLLRHKKHVIPNGVREVRNPSSITELGPPVLVGPPSEAGRSPRFASP
jgi:hypothetical protein